MSKLFNLLRNKIAKLLGLPTKYDIDKLMLEVMIAQREYEGISKEMLGIRADFRTLRTDMKTLYSSLEQNIKNVKMNVKGIKPILKVEDEEAVKFIKGILSKHDHNINTQQRHLEEKMYQMNAVQDKIEEASENANIAVEDARLAKQAIFNVLKGLGFTDEDFEKQQETMENLKEMFKQAKGKNLERTTKTV